MTSLTTTALSPDNTRNHEQCERKDVSFRFLAAATGIATLAGILAGALPVHFAIAIVFLFAGPHNWMELRYFMSRLPSRLGPLKSFFLSAATGIFTLTASYFGLVWLSHATAKDMSLPFAFWNTLLIFWRL